MNLDDFDYNLPKNLIATHPAIPRDHSRLLVLDKNNGKIKHQNFFEIIDYLEKGDLLIFNNSQVIPARLIGKKQKTKGQVEVFLHKKKYEIEDEVWECLLRGKNINQNLMIFFSDDFFCEVLKNNEDGTWQVRFNKKKQDFLKEIEQKGKIPLPPYIEKMRIENDFKENIDDKVAYQTIYANDEKKGSVAAPTAGLHFTENLLEKIKEKGIFLDYVTLHVGMGTFAPVKEENILNHKMHAEWVEINSQLFKKIKEVKNKGGKVITVGTTSTRAIEAVWQNNDNFEKDYKAWVDIFIYPGYTFKIVNAMITNFHLPKSTLLMLVSAFSSKDYIKKAYKEAIENNYRFYSYGDSMLII